MIDAEPVAFDQACGPPAPEHLLPRFHIVDPSGCAISDPDFPFYDKAAYLLIKSFWLSTLLCIQTSRRFCGAAFTALPRLLHRCTGCTMSCTS